MNGQAVAVPYGIGIIDPQVQQTAAGPYVTSGTCFYWLHTHGDDGIIHIEAPAQRQFTLGNFFDIWGKPLSSSAAGESSGAVVVYVNGQKYVGDPRSVPLTAHAVIQLDVGSDTQPLPYTFAPGV